MRALLLPLVLTGCSVFAPWNHVERQREQQRCIPVIKA